MKHLAGFTWLLVPVTGLAANQGLAGWSYAPLEDDLHLTALLQHDVQAGNQRRLGSVQDFIIGEDGNFDAVIVSFDQASPDATAVARMDWEDTVMEPGEDAITVSIGRQEASSGGRSAHPDQGGLQARELIGMTVHLADARSFGRVADILVDRETRQPSAVLVTASGPEGRWYALPLRHDAVRPVDGHVAYDFTREEVLALGEFDAASP